MRANYPAGNDKNGESHKKTASHGKLSFIDLNLLLCLFQKLTGKVGQAS